MQTISCCLKILDGVIYECQLCSTKVYSQDKMFEHEVMRLFMERYNVSLIPCVHVRSLLNIYSNYNISFEIWT